MYRIFFCVVTYFITWNSADSLSRIGPLCHMWSCDVWYPNWPNF